MTNDIWIDLFIAAIGGIFLAHCSMATRREFRAGVAEGLYGSKYDRHRQPAGFWFVLVANMLMAAIGLALLVAGTVPLLER